MISSRDQLLSRDPLLDKNAFANHRQPLHEIEDNLGNQSPHEAEDNLNSHQQQPMNFNHRNRVNYHFSQKYKQQPTSTYSPYIPSQMNKPFTGSQERDPYPINVGRNLDYGGANYKASPESNAYRLGQQQENYSYQQEKSRDLRALPDPLARKQYERQQRIERERRELQEMQQHFPFGKPGVGVPPNRGQNVGRRPYSQIRDPKRFQPMHSSHSNRQILPAQGLNYSLQEVGQYSKVPHKGLNQSFDVDLQDNYYSRTPGAVNSKTNEKITRLESVEQIEERQRRQLEYQQELRQQVEEKKAKQQMLKRQEMEEEMRQEMKIKQDIESENDLARQERSKENKKKGALESRAFEVQSQQNAQSSFKSNKQVQPQAQPLWQAPDEENIVGNRLPKNRETHQDLEPSNQLSLDASMHKIVSNSNANMFSQMENTFQVELQRLKHEMQNQQMDFDSRLKQLREDSRRNIDSKSRAEQEYARAKLISNKNSQGQLMSGFPSIEGGTRRSMGGMDQYGKIFFGGNSALPGLGSQQQDTSSFKTINDYNLQNSPHQLNQFPSEYQNINAHQQSTLGLGGKFEGSMSLKAESSFLPLPAFEDSGNLKANIPIVHQSQPSFQPHKHSGPLPGSSDPGLDYLDKELAEINELNIANIYKDTQLQLERARGSEKPNERFKRIPYYQGIQEGNQGLKSLIGQFNEAKNDNYQGNNRENQEIKQEYLNRNVAPLGPIMESSNEQTFPQRKASSDQIDN